jgi:outer membrane protein TolC
MKNKQYLGMAGAALALVLAAGCETYQEPPLDYQASSYTKRDRTAADNLLVGIKELSLAKAQEIAVANNPTYIAAYYAITAAKMRYYQALGAYSPTLSVNGSLSHTSTEADRQHNVNSANRSGSFNPSVNARAT